MVSEWNQIIGTVKAIGIWDILDIVIVALLIYQVIKLIRETRAMQLAKGLILQRVDFGHCQRLRNPFQNQDRCSDCL